MKNENHPSQPSRVTNVYIDADLPTAELIQLRDRLDLRVGIASPIEDAKSMERPVEVISAVEILLCTYLPTNVNDMQRLKVVQLASSGFSQAEGLGLAARGVCVCNARGVNDTAIAEWNIAMMICLARDMQQLLKNQQSHIWDRARIFQTELRGATVGIWGYGGIGRQTARLCKSLGLQVYVLSRSQVGPARDAFCVSDAGDPEGTLPDRLFEPDQRLEFLKTLDFLVLCLPLNSETEGIVAEKELRALRKTAYVLNPARGPLIKQSPLLQALRERWIAGAALDTHYEYPLSSDHPLWDLNNVIITPHISGSTGSPYFRSRLASLFAQNVDRFLRRRPLLNQVRSERL